MEGEVEDRESAAPAVAEPSQEQKGVGPLEAERALHPREGESEEARGPGEDEGSGCLSETREPGENEGAEGLGKAREARGLGVAGQSEGAGEAGQSEGAVEAGQSEGAGEAGQSEGAGEAGQSEGAVEAGQSEGAGEASQSEGAGEAGQSEGAGEAGQSEGAVEAGQSEGAGEASQSEGAGEPGRAQEARGPEEKETKEPVSERLESRVSEGPEEEPRGAGGGRGTGATGGAGGVRGPGGAVDPDDDSPNMIVYRKIEDIITRIQDETEGVPIRTVKSFLSKIPSVVTGTDIVQWLMKNLAIEDPAEAMHVGSLIAAQGYFFPISDHVLSLKDDGTFYRFQAPYFWPSNCWEPENTDYAIYLCKRTMQNKTRLELADYEAENLARLQRAFARKWEFIFMQAEAQVKIDRKKDKTERKILDSQERAFWDVHRPVPGCVNTTEMDIRKCRRIKNPQRVKKSVYGHSEETHSHSPSHTPSQQPRKGTKDDVEKEIQFLNTQLDRHCMKMSKVAESLMTYTEQHLEYDPFVTTPEPSNPWVGDDCSFWEQEASKDPSQQRVRKWGFSLDEALKDPAGREQFLKFLESEFSSENLRFWMAVQDLKRRPLQDVAERAQEIWAEFLAEGAPSSINLDSHSYERTSQNLREPGRYSYEDAQDHIYKLMKSDSYTRFLRSNAYQDLLLARKKPETEQGRRTSLEKFTRSVGKSLTGKRLTGLMQSS